MDINSQLHNFFNIATNVMCVLDKNFSLVKTNLSFEETLGYNLADITGRRLIDFVHPEDKAVTEKYLMEMESSSEPIDFNNRMMDSNQAIRLFTWRFSKPTSSDFIFATAEDFTKQQEARNLLIKRNRETAESKAKIDAMLSNIGDGIIGTTDGGEILYVNKSTENLLGYKEEELIGKLLLHAIPLVDLNKRPVDSNKRPIRNAMMTGRTAYSRDFQFQRKDGEFLPVAITASPVKYMGTLLGGVVVFRDITKEREIDRMKTEFISLASHQLRTPLSSMKWFTESLLDGDSGELNEDQKKILNNIYISNERMIDLVNALLNISRIESGRLMIEPEPVDLSKLLQEVIVDVSKQIEDKQQKLTISTHENLPKVNLDPKLVRHAFMNLITNAIKYTPANGEIELIISKDNKEIIFRITDSGYGIPKEDQEHIFGKFFRSDNIKKYETDGTGLGLYMVKQIVEASNGRVWFQSEEGKGTTFWIAFPLSGSKKHEGEVAIDS